MNITDFSTTLSSTTKVYAGFCKMDGKDLEFTVTENYDTNSDSTEQNIEFISDSPDGTGVIEIVKTLLNKFNTL
jgi:3-deoxy-D-manno-octulosonic acid (KDO) 8-phosphate synthase